MSQRRRLIGLTSLPSTQLTENRILPALALRNFDLAIPTASQPYKLRTVMRHRIEDDIGYLAVVRLTISTSMQPCLGCCRFHSQAYWVLSHDGAGLATDNKADFSNPFLTGRFKGEAPRKHRHPDAKYLREYGVALEELVIVRSLQPST